MAACSFPCCLYEGVRPFTKIISTHVMVKMPQNIRLVVSFSFLSYMLSKSWLPNQSLLTYNIVFFKLFSTYLLVHIFQNIYLHMHAPMFTKSKIFTKIFTADLFIGL